MDAHTIYQVAGGVKLCSGCLQGNPQNVVSISTNLSTHNRSFNPAIHQFGYEEAVGTVDKELVSLSGVAGPQVLRDLVLSRDSDVPEYPFVLASLHVPLHQIYSVTRLMGHDFTEACCRIADSQIRGEWLYHNKRAKGDVDRGPVLHFNMDYKF